MEAPRASQASRLSGGNIVGIPQSHIQSSRYELILIQLALESTLAKSTDAVLACTFVQDLRAEVTDVGSTIQEVDGLLDNAENRLRGRQLRLRFLHCVNSMKSGPENAAVARVYSDARDLAIARFAELDTRTSVQHDTEHTVHQRYYGNVSITEEGLSLEDLAEKVFESRQALRSYCDSVLNQEWKLEQLSNPSGQQAHLKELLESNAKLSHKVLDYIQWLQIYPAIKHTRATRPAITQGQLTELSNEVEQDSSWVAELTRQMEVKLEQEDSLGHSRFATHCRPPSARTMKIYRQRAAGF